MRRHSFTTLVYTAFFISLSLSSQAHADLIKHPSPWSHRRRADSVDPVQVGKFDVLPGGPPLALAASSQPATSSSVLPQFPASSASSTPAAAPSTTSPQQPQTSSSSPASQSQALTSASPQPSAPAPATSTSSNQQSTTPASAPAQSKPTGSSSQASTSASLSPNNSNNAAPQAPTTPAAQGTQAGQGPNTQAGIDAPSGTIVSNSPTSTNSSGSSKGFFENKALVAGTFSVAGLLAIACVISLGMCWARRRNARRDFDEDELFFNEKHNPLSSPMRSGSPEHEPDLSADDIMDYPRPAYGPGRMQPAHMYPPQPYAPQHAMPPMHMNVDVGDGMAYYGQPVYAPQQYGIDFPPSAHMANPHEGPPTPNSADSSVPASLRPSVKHQSSMSGLAM